MWILICEIVRRPCMLPECGISIFLPLRGCHWLELVHKNQRFSFIVDLLSDRNLPYIKNFYRKDASESEWLRWVSQWDWGVNLELKCRLPFERAAVPNSSVAVPAEISANLFFCMAWPNSSNLQPNQGNQNTFKCFDGLLLWQVDANVFFSPDTRFKFIHLPHLWWIWFKCLLFDRYPCNVSETVTIHLLTAAIIHANSVFSWAHVNIWSRAQTTCRIRLQRSMTLWIVWLLKN